MRGVYPALQEFQEVEMRPRAEQLSFARENRALFPAQYPDVIGILDQGVRAAYDRVAGTTPG